MEGKIPMSYVLIIVMKQMKQNVIIGHVTMFILDVMDIKIVQMETMNGIVQFKIVY